LADIEHDMIDAIRAAATPLLPALPTAAWLPHALIRRPDGRLDKPPCEGSTTADPSTWFTLDGALERLAGHNGVAGIGFAIVSGLIALDFDHCRDPETGELTSTVQCELERLDSYAYVTPSKTGIRIVGRNDLYKPIPGGKFNRFFPDGTKIEIFIGPTNHYNTFTADAIPGYGKIKDISSEALDYLSGLDRGKSASDGIGASNPDPQRSIRAIVAALGAIPNDRRDWDYWCRIGMATWRASGGSQEGFDAWLTWSAKLECHSHKACVERWQHWFRSPPTRLGFGSLYYEARKHRPLFVAPGDDEVVGEAETPREDLSAPPGQAGQARKSDIFETLDIAGLMALPPVQWLVEGILTTDGFSIVYGPPGSLKTFLVLDQALHIASGKPWNDKPVKPGKVLYVAGEGVRGIARRVKAWCHHHKVDPGNIPFRLLPASVNLSEPANVAKLVRTAIAQMEEDGECVALVVIDTVARSIPGLDENSAQEMGLFVAAVEELKTGIACHLLGVHHSGKDETRGARGSNALLGAVDTMVKVKRDDDRLTVTIEKQKDDDEGEPIRLRTSPVEWMDGLKPVKSLVLVPDEFRAAPAAPPPDESTVLLRQVAALLGENGRMITNKIASGLGLSGRKKQELMEIIPLLPDYATVIPYDNGPTVRLAKRRTGSGTTSPVEVVRYDVA